MLNFLSGFFRSSKLRDAAARALEQKCGLRLGPVGQACLKEHADAVAKKAGNSHDAAVLVLLTMVEHPDEYGLDHDTCLSLVREAMRLSKDAALPTTAPAAAAAYETVRDAGQPAVWRPK